MITIGIDPHKSSLTAVALEPSGEIAATIRLEVNNYTVDRLLAWAIRGECAEEFAADVALEAADDLAAGAAFGGTTGEVLAGSGVVAESVGGRGVECSVGLAIAAAVEPVALGVARGRWQRGDSAERGERGFGADAPAWDQACNTVAATMGPTPAARGAAGPAR